MEPVSSAGCKQPVMEEAAKLAAKNPLDCILKSLFTAETAGRREQEVMSGLKMYTNDLTHSWTVQV